MNGTVYRPVFLCERKGLGGIKNYNHIQSEKVNILPCSGIVALMLYLCWDFYLFAWE